MTSHEYYGTQPNGLGHDQGQGYNGVTHQRSYESHDSNYPPEGQAYGQQTQYQNGYGHSPYPHDQPGLAMPSHESYAQAPQNGYGAPQDVSYDQHYDPNRSTSPYPPQHQVGPHDANQHYGAPQQQGYHDPQKDYGAGQHVQNGQNGQLGEPSVSGEPAEGERGLGSTLIGGAGGALLGHKLGGGAMGTFGGMVAGAIGANMLNNEKEKKKKHRKHRKHDSHSSHTGSHSSNSHHGSSHSHSHHGSQSSHSHHGSHSSHSHHGRHSSHHGSSYNGSSAGLDTLYVPSHDGHHRRHSRSRSRGRMSSSSSSGSDSE